MRAGALDNGRRRISSQRALGVTLAAAIATAAPAAAQAAPAPAPVVAPGGAPVGGALRLTLRRAGGEPLFALLGHEVLLRGVVTPYVAGQTVKISVYREGRKVGVRVLPVLAAAHGAGQFRYELTSHVGGSMQARVAHYATAQQGAFSARAPAVRFVNPNVGPGERGQSVRLLQAELDALHYAVPLSGCSTKAPARR